ncbi:MAG: tetratricopeptide repeat protein [Armatimonadetes bacterium]|nr:tetratricopeptide repeat protein [Candidatus Hippobium faecium]
MSKLFMISLLLVMFGAMVSAYEINCDKGFEKYKDTVKEELGKDIQDVIDARAAACDIFKDHIDMSQDLAYILGCDDKTGEIFLDLKYSFYDSKVIETTLSHIRVMSYEEARKNPVLDAGFVSYEFPDEKTVNLVFSSMTSQGEEKDFYLPVLVDREGNIVKKEELRDGIISVGGNTELKGPLMLMEDVNEIITQKLRIEYPFSRWFNEGMNYKVTSYLLHKYKSPYAEKFDKLFAVSEESRKLKSKADLWNFVQFNLVSKNDYSAETETANIQYSCQLADKLFDKVGAEGFRKIFSEMKFSEMLTNPQICNMIKNVTDFDMQALLFEYVPDSVKNLTDTKKLDTLEDNAKELMSGEKYTEAAKVLESVLLGNPYRYNARLNLARCYREVKDFYNSDKNIFIAANSMIPGQANLSFYGKDGDCILTVIGKYLFMSGALSDAYKFLQKAYETDKSDDIKQILESIDLTRENMNRELYGGE